MDCFNGLVVRQSASKLGVANDTYVLTGNWSGAKTIWFFNSTIVPTGVLGTFNDYMLTVFFNRPSQPTLFQNLVTLAPGQWGNARVYDPTTGEPIELAAADELSFFAGGQAGDGATGYAAAPYAQVNRLT